MTRRSSDFETKRVPLGPTSIPAVLIPGLPVPVVRSMRLSGISSAPVA